MHRILLGLSALALATTAAAQSPLSTLFASNNSGSVGGAVYFDLTVNVPVSITQIDINTATAGTGSLDVYTIPGGAAGNMGSSAGWTGPSVLGSPVTLSGSNVPSPAALVTPLALTPGTYGVALVASGFGHYYTNGNGANQTYSTVELTFNGGYADNVPWSGGAFTPRVANVNIHYSVGSPGTVLATATNYGQGCVSQPEVSFYEYFSSGTFDLTAPVDTMLMLNGGTGYIGLTGISSYVPPTAAATGLSLSDDSSVQVALSQPLKVGRNGSTSTLHVCSNGFVSVGSNGTSYSPSVATMLGNTHTAWYCWHDFNPNSMGTVWFEEIGNVAYVTWDNVPSFGQTVGETFQFQFDLVSGNVSIVWVSISGLGNDMLVGYSEGGASADPGPTDLSVALPLTIPTLAIFAVDPLALDAASRPIANTTIDMEVSNLGPTTIFGAVSIGLNQLPTPLDLTAIGMTGCNQYADQLVNLLFFPAGAGTYLVPLVVPNMLNLNLHAQAFSYDPLSGLTALGALSSNATHLMTGDW